MFSRKGRAKDIQKSARRLDTSNYSASLARPLQTPIKDSKTTLFKVFFSPASTIFTATCK